MQDGRLLEILESANGAFEDNEAKFEDVEGSFGLEVDRLADGALHEGALGRVHFENTG